MPVAMVVYLPQFYLPHAERVGRGALVTVGACCESCNSQGISRGSSSGR